MEVGYYWTSIALFIVFILLTLNIMGFFSKTNQFPVDGKTVVVTGGSQGLGLGLGKLLAEKGANVVLVARNVKKLQDAVEYISAAAKNPQTQRFHYISADLIRPEENARLLKEVTEWNHSQPPDVVFANAGSSTPGLWVDTSIETLRSQMDTNYWAAAYLAHETLNLWLQPAGSLDNSVAKKDVPTRHFVITSSSAAYSSVAGYVTYTPAKAALISLSDGLASELNLYAGARQSAIHAGSAPVADVKIHTLTPGNIDSPGHAQEELVKHPITRQLEKDDPMQTADEVARIAVDGLERGYYLISTNWLGKILRVLSLSGGPRDHWLWDTVGPSLMNFAWQFIQPDLDRQVFKWGKENGIRAPPTTTDSKV